MNEKKKLFQVSNFSFFWWMLFCTGPELFLAGNHLKVSGTVNTD